MSTAAQRLRMAETIKNFEARRDRKGRLQVYDLPPGDGGGAYEVAGINQRYNRKTCDKLVALVRAGRYADAEALANEFIAKDTDAVAKWSTIPAIEFYLRDSCFNRGAKGAATILQLAVGAEVDGRVGKDTRKALAAAERNPQSLLRKLRAARERYERTTYPWKRHARNERSKFWKGLVNRWNKALAAARKFPMASGGAPEPAPREAPRKPPKKAPKHAPPPKRAPSQPVPDAWRVLRRRRRGADVKAWQRFLRARGIDTGPIDGIYGPLTSAGTAAFQRKHRLVIDGIVGPETYGKAMALGYKGPAPKSKPRRKRSPRKPQPAPTRVPGDLAYPMRPSFKPLVSTQQRQALFGPFRYVAAPRPDEPRAIRILGTWQRDNIVRVAIPQLKKTAIGSRAPATMRFHRKAAAQLKAMWAEWEAAGLLDRILSYEGSYNARFIGGTTTLSNHAFGTAFDINIKYNPWKRPPAKPGQKGCVYELVPIANKWGFYWGGHYSRRSIDGMHFEVAVIKP
jgi:lysozyme family protein